MLGALSCGEQARKDMKARSNSMSKKRRAEFGLTRAQYRQKREVKNTLARFGHYLRDRREAANLTFRLLGGRARIAHSNIYQIEQSKKDPHLGEIMKLAQAFNEPLRQFLAPFLQEHDEELDAVAECAEERGQFTEISLPKSEDNPVGALPEER
jgi:transcriptional regulator with XRE-family HTH domain